ncbi:MAG TPA: MBL fold metallo-hydrolase [Propioniciclava sp.]|uniref:MBL fold metallo-hydrolase RNA specificity domain-containing protein n=1 Tax=Propioniciclava sp. TaxID=2038686 RepID=UPI002C808EE1|nr:MBL fold metallo-hydrolase RNA specificity domain-containing protein [Propioniciclava sp.]HRL48909.1 MBL fold metallo-hydrolase [Propioniciclava sp.]HRL80088.1 MBL fold metallo-hydrolase [Propioniciclava sp.]
MAGALTTTLMFLGAAGTVTGSKYLVTVGARRILVDAGMFQGEKKWRLKNWEEFPVDPASISDVILTHAHMDHVGYLPALARNGFDGPVWCTPGTRELAEIVMRDAAKLQELEAQDANERGYSKHSPALPLYTTADVEDLLPQFVALEYDTDFELTGDERPGFTPDADQTVTIRLSRAGHILGSASVNLWTPTATVLFSGDLGRHDHPVLRPRDIPLGAPTVLIESTYGDREHPEPDTLPHEGFADVIRRTIERGGSVVVPAFAIDRTEVVLKTISDLERDGRIPDVPVFVDSPMGVRALRVYQSQPDELRPDLRPEDFLAIPDLTAVESPEDSKRLTAPNGHRPAVIISSSGMATGGRVLHHLETLLPDARNAVVLTGYQGVGTRGRQLSEGAEQVKINGRYVPVRAEVYHDREFSVHADGSDLLDWLAELRPRPATVYCVHGEADSAAALAARIQRELHLNAVVPRHGEVVVVDAGTAAQAAIKAPAPSPEHGEPAPQRSRSRAARVAADPVNGSAPRYRLVTGRSDADFERRVNEALEEGYQLQGPPSLAFDGDELIVAQPLIAPPRLG